MTTADYDNPGEYCEDGLTEEETRAQRLLGLVRNGSWLREQDFPELQWAVPDVLPEGFGLVVGAPKVGKSFLVLGIALAVASGGTALGHIHLGYPPRPVLYLALEDGPRRIQKRSAKLLQGRGDIPDLLHIVTDVLTAAEVEELIRLWLDAHAGQKPLVVLDTLGKVMPPARAGETQYSRDYRIGGTFLQIAKEHPGSTIWIVHHTRKVQSSDWMDATSGTNGLNGSADFTLMIARERGKPDGTLYVTGREIVEGEYAVQLSEHMQWSLAAPTLEAAAAAAAERSVTEGLGDRSVEIVGYVAGHPGCGPTEIATALGLVPSDVGTYLQRLVKAGRLAKVSRGVYRAASSPPETPVESVEEAIRSPRSFPPVEREESDATHSTLSTPLPRVCTLCGEPLGRLDLAEGATRHAGCLDEAAS